MESRLRSRALFAELFFAFAFLLIPPILSPPAPFAFPDLQTVFVCAALAAWFAFERRFTDRQRAERLSFRAAALCSAASLLALFACAAGISLACQVAGIGARPPAEAAVRAAFAEQTGGAFLHDAAGFAVLAAYEEALYRVFLPARLACFRAPTPALLSAALFALAHRSGGLSATLNALAAGGVLHWCYAKTRSLPAVCVPHGLYNLLAGVLASL
ncbi:CPBP family intramembrane glutamic endopeptidase [Treponema endosymbiont of Eucomonympha sp.]|uniref:CPBP family intramembrane glutamic endopeptidase n=1 Tax=Treponema endosymbiont of Eucomonympha sp. TaxID=1580831 RepID=UPI0007820F1B|nr:CPBP family intramembrane glutamic endopeptidase [Treponema endosymbiont of Eucomonympha sp.]